MSLPDEIKSAIGLHGQWKSRLDAAIATGTSEFSVSVVRQDNQCVFGKWLYGPAWAGEIRNSQHYKDVRELHRQFHCVAADVLALALAGKKSEAIQAMHAQSEFAQCSAKLTKAMMAWLEAATVAHTAAH